MVDSVGRINKDNYIVTPRDWIYIAQIRYKGHMSAVEGFLEKFYDIGEVELFVSRFEWEETYILGGY